MLIIFVKSFMPVFLFPKLWSILAAKPLILNFFLTWELNLLQTYSSSAQQFSSFLSYQIYPKFYFYNSKGPLIVTPEPIFLIPWTLHLFLHYFPSLWMTFCFELVFPFLSYSSTRTQTTSDLSCHLLFYALTYDEVYIELLYGVLNIFFFLILLKI